VDCRAHPEPIGNGAVDRGLAEGPADRAAKVPGRLFHDLHRNAVRHIARAGVRKTRSMFDGLQPREGGLESPFEVFRRSWLRGTRIVPGERQAICARIPRDGACAPRTFSDYVQDYGKWAGINTRGWVQTERYSAERPAAALVDQPLESITSAFVEGAFERLLAGRSGATRNRYCDWLSGMFKRAVRLGLVAMNPVTGIPKLVRRAGERCS
jgi:hypothetical protein